MELTLSIVALFKFWSTQAGFAPYPEGAHQITMQIGRMRLERVSWDQPCCPKLLKVPGSYLDLHIIGLHTQRPHLCPDDISPLSRQ